MPPIIEEALRIYRYTEGLVETSRVEENGSAMAVALALFTVRKEPGIERRSFRVFFLIKEGHLK